MTSMVSETPQLDSTHVYPQYEMDPAPATKPGTTELDHAGEAPMRKCHSLHPRSLTPGMARSHDRRPSRLTSAASTAGISVQVPAKIYLHGPNGETLTADAPRATLNATLYEQSMDIHVNNWAQC